MPIDRDAYVEKYLDELKENIEAIDSSILQLKKTPGDEHEQAEILRALHTVKGSSRLLRFNNTEQVVHGLENVFKNFSEKRLGVTKHLVRTVFLATGHLRLAAARIAKNGNDDLPADELLGIFEKVGQGEPLSPDDLTSFREGMREGEKSKSGPNADRPVSGYDTIRIKTSKTEKMIRILNNLMIKQFRFKRGKEAFNDLELKFLDLAEKSEGPEGKKSPGRIKSENECLKQIRRIAKNYSHDLALLENNMNELRDEILGLRMLPLKLIFGSLAKMVEETAMNLGKEINFTVAGAGHVIDKVILEKLNDPVIHIVRNAVDHGIETPNQRRRKNKNGAGRLDIACSLESGHIVIRIKDDGKGLDYEKIRTKAMTLNPGREDTIAAMSDDDLLSFIFSPGFSTIEKAKDLSGRGIGLDIVKYNIEQIKGKIAVRSETDKGTEFVITLPLSLATLEGFFVMSAEEKFLIPSNFVKEIVIIDAGMKLDLLDREAIKLRGEIVPIHYLSELLGSDHNSTRRQFAVVVETMNEMTGIVVDSVIRHASLIYKPLPKNLSKLKVLQGIVFDESYNIINILYVPELIDRLRGFRNFGLGKYVKYNEKRILVVDDSYATRQIERSILELENYIVVTARDGIDGLKKLGENDIDLIITDINMPGMDGLNFVKNLRVIDKYKNTPVIVMSADRNREAKNEFLANGATSFIVKSDFDRGNLVQEVKNLIGGN